MLSYCNTYGESRTQITHPSMMPEASMRAHRQQPKPPTWACESRAWSPSKGHKSWKGSFERLALFSGQYHLTLVVKLPSKEGEYLPEEQDEKY